MGSPIFRAGNLQMVYGKWEIRQAMSSGGENDHNYEVSTAIHKMLSFHGQNHIQSWEIASVGIIWIWLASDNTGQIIQFFPVSVGQIPASPKLYIFRNVPISRIIASKYCKLYYNNYISQISQKQLPHPNTIIA